MKKKTFIIFLILSLSIVTVFSIYQLSTSEDWKNTQDDRNLITSLAIKKDFEKLVATGNLSCLFHIDINASKQLVKVYLTRDHTLIMCEDQLKRFEYLAMQEPFSYQIANHPFY